MKLYAFKQQYAHFMQVMNQQLNGNGWVVEVAIFLGITIIISATVAITLSSIHKRLHKSTKNRHWDKIIVRALDLPCQLLIWVVGLCYIADIFQNVVSNQTVFQFVAPLRMIGIIVAFIWFLLRLVRFAEEYFSEPRMAAKYDVTTVHAISKISRITVLAIGALVLLQSIGIKTSGIVAFGGVGGLAVGFAAKDLLANFFGGFVIAIDKPFRVGDWIRSPDRNIEGTVEQIGWRITRIRTFDKRPLFVPNSAFLTISVENPSRMQNRRIKTTVGVRYDDWHVVEKITHDIETMLREHPDIDTRQTLFVKLIDFAPSSLTLLVYTFTKTTAWVQYQEIQQDVYLKILKIIDDNDAECAFPTSTLHIAKAGDFAELGA